jgi:hypothetical protein
MSNDYITEETAKFTLAVSGARIFNDYNKFQTQLLQYLKDYHSDNLPSKMVAGGAYGADTLAKKFATERKIEFLELKPEWAKHGKKAGILRNKDIVDAATHVIAFPKGVSSGTRHAIAYAKEKNKPVVVYEQELPDLPATITNILQNSKQNELQHSNSFQSSS